MAIKLNEAGFRQAKKLIEDGKTARDDRDAWSEHQPSASKGNQFIEKHGYKAYGRWFLGIDTDQNEEAKGHYTFPYGDFSKLHRCGVLSAESRAGQYQHKDIEDAAAHLHGMLEEAHQTASR